MPKKRLLWRLYPSYLIITVFALFAVTWYVNRAFRQFYLSNTATDLEARAHLIRSQIPLPILPEDYSRITAQCERLGHQSKTRITVILPSGVVIGDSDEDPSVMENHADRPEIAEAMQGRVGVSDRFSATLNTQMMYVAVPVTEGLSVSAVVRTAIPITEVETAIRRVYRQIAVGGLFVIVLAALISLLVSRQITRPLERLKRAAERMADGDFEGRLLIPESDEIGSVAEAMNKMAEQLDDRIRTVVQQRQQEEAVLASMMESVLAVDTDERILSVNHAAAELFGIDPPGTKGRRIQEVIRNSTLHEFVRRTLRSDEPVEGEIALNGNDERFLQVHGTALRDPDGRHIGALLALNDVTRMRRLERVRRDFVANVSHELKTPITTIKGFVETLLGGALASRDDTERFLKIIAKHTDRLNAIIEDLLSLSRIEQESEQEVILLNRGRVDEVVRLAIDALKMNAESRNVRIQVRDNRQVECPLNPQLLEQAIVNLIDNAIKFSDEGSVVTVETRHTGDEVVISVIDDGVGIEADHLPRLFERFYRTDRARSRSMGGTGLGLAIVKHIAIAHGGRVAVESTPGQGSTFSIFLPVGHANSGS